MGAAPVLSIGPVFLVAGHSLQRGYSHIPFRDISLGPRVLGAK